MFTIAFVLIAGLAYLLGSVSPSFLVGELTKGTDLRKHGSGNLGFSNALRVLGKGPGIVVLLLDILKGVGAVWMGKLLAARYFGFAAETVVLLEVVAGMAVILGHIYTCFLNFKGGKGVATALGVFIFLAPGAVACAVLVFAVTVYFTRYMSLGSILAALSLPLFLWWKSASSSCCASGVSVWVILLSIIIAIMVVIKHLPNIQRLLAGCENKFTWSKQKDV